MATRSDIITRALRRLRVVAHNRVATADHEANVGTVLDSVFEEIQGVNATPWTLDDVPEECVHPLAELVAVEMAPEFSRPAPTTRPRAWVRLMAIINPDDWSARREDDVPEYY